MPRRRRRAARRRLPVRRSPSSPSRPTSTRQGHLNNAATVRLFNDLRVAYVRGEVGARWLEHPRRTTSSSSPRARCTCSTSRRGCPGESFVGAMRYVAARGQGRRARAAPRRGDDRPAGRPGVGGAAARAARHGRRLARRATSPASPRSRAARSRRVPRRPAVAVGTARAERRAGQAPSSVQQRAERGRRRAAPRRRSPRRRSRRRSARGRRRPRSRRRARSPRMRAIGMSPSPGTSRCDDATVPTLKSLTCTSRMRSTPARIVCCERRARPSTR